MNKYKSSGFRSVYADSPNEAAMIFASRAARKAYGRKGYGRTLLCNAWSQDFTMHEYSAFIGYRSGQNETTGYTVHFTVFTM